MQKDLEKFRKKINFFIVYKMDITEFICLHCHKKFSTKSNLSAHQKTAKYCLEKQGKDDNGNFDCEFCQKKFRVKQTLIDHYHACKEKLKKDAIQIMQHDIITLKQSIEEKEINISKEMTFIDIGISQYFSYLTNLA